MAASTGGVSLLAFAKFRQVEKTNMLIQCEDKGNLHVRGYAIKAMEHVFQGTVAPEPAEDPGDSYMKSLAKMCSNFPSRFSADANETLKAYSDFGYGGLTNDLLKMLRALKAAIDPLITDDMRDRERGNLMRLTQSDAESTMSYTHRIQLKSEELEALGSVVESNTRCQIFWVGVNRTTNANLMQWKTTLMNEAKRGSSEHVRNEKAAQLTRLSQDWEYLRGTAADLGAKDADVAPQANAAVGEQAKVGDSKTSQKRFARSGSRKNPPHRDDASKKSENDGRHCEICAAEKFATYRRVTSHSTSEHQSPEEFRESRGKGTSRREHASPSKRHNTEERSGSKNNAYIADFNKFINSINAAIVAKRELDTIDGDK